jgi:hypothetical protein
MTTEHRLTRLEKQIAPPEPPMTFRLCDARSGSPTEEHEAYHRQRDEECFTLNIGDCGVTDDDR